jgi:dTDP-4-dehydrorhamnose 3,5-epimerase
MRVEPAEIADVLIIQPRVFADERGFFLESYNRRAFRQETGIDVEFVQDNHSRSAQNVLRGLHYQIRQPQGKLVRVTVGEIWDVAVDLRARSPTFGKWAAFALDAASARCVWIPPGFAHGFLVLSEAAEVQYKTTEYYAPEYERTLLWNDPALGIPWPLRGEPVLAEKDRKGAPLAAAERFA